jgi:acyl carrier protein
VLLADVIQQQAARTMGLADSETIDPGRPLTDLGLDSLMAVELRNVIAQQIGKSLPATILFSYPTIDQLTSYLLDDVLAADLGRNEMDESSDDVVRRTESPVEDDTELDKMSEEEIASLLENELEDLD